MERITLSHSCPVCAYRLLVRPSEIAAVVVSSGGLVVHVRGASGMTVDNTVANRSALRWAGWPVVDASE